jgi:type II secretory pathway pseudopilin PulG
MTRPRPDPGAKRGLTLVELMVSATLVAGVVGSACLCLITGRRAGDEAERRMDVLQSARVALERMTRDLQVACPLDPDFALIGMDRSRDGVEADNIDFATHNWTPRCPGESDLCEVSYFVDPDPETGDLALFRRRDPSPDAEPLAGGYREQIVVGVRAFRLEYYDGVAWYDEWGSALESGETFTNRTDDVGYEAGLPEAVRITLVLGPPRRHGTGGANPAPDEDPPRVFRTVVRLVLAGRERETSGGAADTSTPAAEPEAAAPESSEGEG